MFSRNKIKLKKEIKKKEKKIERGAALPLCRLWYICSKEREMGKG